jgi:hypothetical protein
VGFLRREPKPPPALETVVGVDNHRVRIHGAERGITTLDELRTYVASVTGGAARPLDDGRDPVAVLSAKMDLAELVNDTVNATLLALEDLVERGLVDPGEIPRQPQLAPMPERVAHYQYIQVTHARAEARLVWLGQIDALLRAREAALLPPAPELDPTRRTALR